MSESAHIRSLDALRSFAAAVVQFREEARICLTQIEMEISRIIGWIERDRPGFWKREIELCDRRFAEARVLLHQCRMRRVGDFRPTCYEEQKNVQYWKQQLEFARRQIGVIRHWSIQARQEAEEYQGRASQLMQALERDLPRLIALLQQSADRIDSYSRVRLPSWSPDRLDFGDPAAWTERQDGDGRTTESGPEPQQDSGTPADRSPNSPSSTRSGDD